MEMSSYIAGQKHRSSVLLQVCEKKMVITADMLCLYILLLIVLVACYHYHILKWEA